CHCSLLNCSFHLRHKHAGRRWIRKPQNLPILRADDLCRKLVWLVWTFEYGLECRRFLRSMRHEDDPGRVVQDRRCERDSICVQLSHPVTDDQALLFLEGLCSRKEGGRMSFGTHAQEHEVETGQGAPRQPETCPQIFLVFRRSFDWVRNLTFYAMNLLRIDWGFREHRFRGHSEVALRIVWRYVPFVSEEKLNLLPRQNCPQRRVVKEQSVQYFRCRAAREGDRKRAL